MDPVARYTLRRDIASIVKIFRSLRTLGIILATTSWSGLASYGSLADSRVDQGDQVHPESLANHTNPLVLWNFSGIRVHQTARSTFFESKYFLQNVLGPTGRPRILR